MEYKNRVKLLKFIGDMIGTSNDSRKYVYALMNGSPDSKFVSRQLSINLLTIEKKHNDSLTAVKVFAKSNLEILLEAIKTCNDKEKDANAIKMMMSLVVLDSKDSIFEKHKIITTKKGFEIESSKGLFSKKSHNLTPAMLEYIIFNGAKKKNSNGKISSVATDSLIDTVLEFNSSNNGHEKFLKIAGKASIENIEDMKSELENNYKMKNSIPQYIIDLAYDISLSHIIISRNDRLIISYKSAEGGMIRSNIDLWDYKPLMNALLKGESITHAIDNFTHDTVKKM